MADVDPGVEETRTVDLPDITKSVQEPLNRPNPWTGYQAHPTENLR
jgi:hypothetical protein